VQCTRTMALSKVIVQLFILLLFRRIFLVWSITWKPLVEFQFNLKQWSSTLSESAVHKNHSSILTNYKVIALHYFFLVQCITWKLTVECNFMQWSSTIRGSTVHKNHNSIQSNYRVIALCYLSLLQSITWNVVVGIQYKFVQWSGILRGRAVHRDITHFRVIALCYFLAHLSMLRVSFYDRWLSVVRSHLVVNTLAVTFLPQSSSNLVRMFT
jgi:hypothetical protein